MAIGNLVSQTLIEHRTLLSLEWSRTFRFAAFGYLIGVKRRKSNSIDQLCSLRFRVLSFVIGTTD